MRLAPFILATAATAVPLIEKRCRLGRGIQPCWVIWDHSECEAYRPVGVEYVIDRPNRQITINGVCESCSRALVLERALIETQGLHDSWATSFGHVEDLGNGTLVISNTDDWALSFHQSLGLFPRDWGTSCVRLEDDYPQFP